MGQARSEFSYPDCRVFMDNAIEAEKGWKVIFELKGQATNFRMRCYTARGREERRNAKIYDQGDPMFNSSVWSGLTFAVEKVEGKVLCERCGEDAGKEHWQLLAIQGDNSLDAKCLSHGAI